MQTLPRDILKYHLVPFLGLRDEARAAESGAVSSCKDSRILWSIVSGKTPHASEWKSDSAIPKDLVWRMIHDRKESFPHLKGPGHPLIRIMMCSKGFFEGIAANDQVKFSQWMIQDDPCQWNDVYEKDKITGKLSIENNCEVTGALELPVWIAKEALKTLAGSLWLARKSIYNFPSLGKANSANWNQDDISSDVAAFALIELALIQWESPEEKLFIRIGHICESLQQADAFPFFALAAYIHAPFMPPSIYSGNAIRDSIEDLMTSSKEFGVMHWKARMHILEALIQPDILAEVGPDVTRRLKVWLGSWQETADACRDLERERLRALECCLT